MNCGIDIPVVCMESNSVLKPVFQTVHVYTPLVLLIVVSVCTVSESQPWYGVVIIKSATGSG